MASNFSVGVKYYSLLLFHDKSFWDLKDNNAWELFGETLEHTSTASGFKKYGRRDDITHENPWFAARCDLEKSRFDGDEEALSTNNCFSSVAPGGYLHHRNPITVPGHYSTMACWFKIREQDANEFYGGDDYHITLWDWDNENNVHIHVEIRARDDNDKLIECIKVFYDSKLYQVNAPEPILNDTWYYFSYAVNEKTDAFYINGSKILEVTNNRGISQPNMIYKNIKIGAHDNLSSGGLNIDEFIIVNDYLINGFPYAPGKPIIWIRPELFHLDELYEGNNLYYQYGSTLRLNYVLYHPIKVSSPYLEFEFTQGFPLALFRDQSIMSDSEWTGNVRKIKLLNTTGITTSSYTLVTVVKFSPDNNREYINGCSLYDHLLHPIRITRIGYWTKPPDADRDMFNKIRWYQNNKIPMSNFEYYNKFDPDKKQWS